MFSVHAFTANWFIHQIASAMIHSAIYGMAYHIFRDLSTGQALFAGAAMLLLAAFIVGAAAYLATRRSRW